MDFTRDPIIETIISPKDGYKLSVKSSRHADAEEYLVTAIEVVSFGSALFFRSIEKPKAFLLPIADYEIVEVKEARMVLKNVSVDKPIKIGESRDSKSSSDDKESEGKKNTKKKNSRKRRPSPKAESPSSEKETPKKKAQKSAQPLPKEEGGDLKDEAAASSSVSPIVFPTPPKIIGRKLPSPESEKVSEGDILPDELVSDTEPESLEADGHHEEEIVNLDAPVEKAEEPKKEDQEA